VDIILGPLVTLSGSASSQILDDKDVGGQKETVTELFS
jgi:hypothetical protein